MNSEAQRKWPLFISGVRTDHDGRQIGMRVSVNLCHALEFGNMGEAYVIVGDIHWLNDQGIAVVDAAWSRTFIPWSNVAGIKPTT